MGLFDKAKNKVKDFLATPSESTQTKINREQVITASGRTMNATDAANAAEYLSSKQEEAYSAKKDEERKRKAELDISWLKRTGQANSEFSNFINTNWPSEILKGEMVIKGNVFCAKLAKYMQEKGKNMLIMSADDKRSVMVTLNPKNKKISTMHIKDKASNTSNKIYDEEMGFKALEGTLNKLYKELHPESNVVKNYSHIVWDNSYQGEKNEQKKKEIINNVYNKLLDSTFYNEAQAKTLVKIMMLNYDINCFSNPLYSQKHMELLAQGYAETKASIQIKYPTDVSDPEMRQKNKIASEMTLSKLENKLRDMNKFCSKNFKYKFSDSEFMRIKIASDMDALNELALDPNLPADFKLFYAMDAACDQGVPQKINIGNRVFVVDSSLIFNKNNELEGVNTIISEEFKDNGSFKLKPIFKEIHGKEPWGSLDVFYDAYKSKYSIKDSMELLNLYVQEIKNGIIDDTNANNEITLSLSNGEKLKIEGILYPKNGIDSDIIDGNEMEMESGVNIYYKSKGKTELIYSDKMANKALYYNLSTLLRRCGGLVPDERVAANPDRDKNIEDEILSEKPIKKQNIEYLEPEEMFKKCADLAKTNGIFELKMPNGEKFKFEKDSFMKGEQKIIYAKVAHITKNNDYQDIYVVYTKDGKNILRGSKDVFYDRYKNALYNGSLDQKINTKNSQPKQNDKNINNDRDR